MMSEWSHLPNAKHIDNVIMSFKNNPDPWAMAWDITYNPARMAACDAAWHAARNAARDAARNAARIAAWHAAWHAARNAARNAAYRAALNAAHNAIMALIAYDDSTKYLDMSSEILKTWAIITEDPAAFLLFPAVIAFEKIIQKEEI
jgi:hypothetical protein